MADDGLINKLVKNRQTLVIPTTSTKKKVNVFDSFRPKPGYVLDYNISETFATLNAGYTKVNVRETVGHYVPSPNGPVQRVKRDLKHSAPKYEFIDEKWRRQQEARQQEYKDNLKELLKNRKKETIKGSRLHNVIKSMVGPEWFQELSPNQIQTVENLKTCIDVDLLRNTIENTEWNIECLGLLLRPNHRHIKKALQKCGGCPVEFLLILYQLINPKRKSYSINDRLLLSAVVHLTMTFTLRELHIRIPSPPRTPPDPPPKPPKNKKQKYDSVYLEPLMYRPAERIITHCPKVDIQYPESSYFAYVKELKLETMFVENDIPGVKLKKLPQADKELFEELNLAQRYYDSLTDGKCKRKLLPPTVLNKVYQLSEEESISEIEEEVQIFSPKIPKTCPELCTKPRVQCRVKLVEGFAVRNNEVIPIFGGWIKFRYENEFKCKDVCLKFLPAMILSGIAVKNGHVVPIIGGVRKTPSNIIDIYETKPIISGIAVRNGHVIPILNGVFKNLIIREVPQYFCRKCLEVRRAIEERARLFQDVTGIMVGVAVRDLLPIPMFGGFRKDPLRENDYLCEDCLLRKQQRILDWQRKRSVCVFCIFSGIAVRDGNPIPIVGGVSTISREYTETKPLNQVIIFGGVVSWKGVFIRIFAGIKKLPVLKTQIDNRMLTRISAVHYNNIISGIIVKNGRAIPIIGGIRLPKTEVCECAQKIVRRKLESLEYQEKCIIIGVAIRNNHVLPIVGGVKRFDKEITHCCISGVVLHRGHIIPVIGGFMIQRIDGCNQEICEGRKVPSVVDFTKEISLGKGDRESVGDVSVQVITYIIGNVCIIDGKPIFVIIGIREMPYSEHDNSAEEEKSEDEMSETISYDTNLVSKRTDERPEFFEDIPDEEISLCVDETTTTTTDDVSDQINCTGDCKDQLEEFLNKKCKMWERIQQKRNATFTIGGTAIQNGRPIRILSGVKAINCNCIQNYLDSVKQYEDQKQLQNQSRNLIREKNFLVGIGGLTSTSGGPSYLITSVHPVVDIDYLRDCVRIINAVEDQELDYRQTQRDVQQSNEEIEEMKSTLDQLKNELFNLIKEDCDKNDCEKFSKKITDLNTVSDVRISPSGNILPSNINIPEVDCKCLRSYIIKLQKLDNDIRIQESKAFLQTKKPKYVITGIAQTPLGPILVLQTARPIISMQQYHESLKFVRNHKKLITYVEPISIEKHIETYTISRTPSEEPCKCKEILQDLLRNACECDKCRAEARRKSDLKVMSCTDVYDKQCSCLVDFQQKISRLENYKRRMKIRRKLKQEKTKFVIGGVTETPYGPIYNIYGIRPPIFCKCGELLQKHEEEEHRLTVMPKLPDDGVKYHIEGVKKSSPTDVYILSSAQPVKDCSCMRLFDKFENKHSPCMEVYDKYLQQMKEFLKQYMNELEQKEEEDDIKVIHPFKEKEDSTRNSLSDQELEEQKIRDKENEEIAARYAEEMRRILTGERDLGVLSKQEEDEISDIENITESDEESNYDADDEEFTFQINTEVKPEPILPEQKLCMCMFVSDNEDDCSEGGGRTVKNKEREIKERKRRENENLQTQFKRFVILPKFPRKEKEQYKILKKVLRRMANDGFPLAKLPDCDKLPHFKLWLQMRAGVRWGIPEKRDYLFSSKNLWKHTDSCNLPSLEPPSLPISRHAAENVTWMNAKYCKKLVAENRELYYRNAKQNTIERVREFLPTLYTYEFTNKTFRDTYFAYCPAKEIQSFPFRIVKAKDMTPIRKRYKCNIP